MAVGEGEDQEVVVDSEEEGELQLAENLIEEGGSGQAGQGTGFTYVLCVGCWSIFECPAVLISQFYSSDHFLWYNLLNGHFFFHGEESSTVFRDFLISCDKLLILLDPPFGAKTELISHSLDRIINQ